MQHACGVHTTYYNAMHVNYFSEACERLAISINNDQIAQNRTWFSLTKHYDITVQMD